MTDQTQQVGLPSDRNAYGAAVVMMELTRFGVTIEKSA